MAEMRKFRAVFKREYLERVRSKWFLIVTLLGPLFFAGISLAGPIIAARSGTSRAIANVIVIDATGAAIGPRVAQAIYATRPDSLQPEVRTVPVRELAAAESLATAEVIAKRRMGYLVLDAKTLGGTELRYAGRNATSPVDVQVLERAVQRTVLAMRLEGEGISPERVATLTNVRLDTRTEKITDKGREQAGGMASLLFAYVIFFLLYMILAIYGQTILRGVMEEKTTRVAEVVISSARPTTLLMGKVLGISAVAITQLLAWIAMAGLIYLERATILGKFGVPAAAAGAFRIPTVDAGTAVALILYFVLGLLFYSALYAAVGAMVSSQEDVNQASMPVTLLLIASVVLVQVVLLKPGEGLARVLSLLPFSAPIIMPTRMALIAVPWWEIIAGLLSVGIGCALALWLSARIYRVGMLMYGKRPSFAEVARWVRYS
ncbi:MAG TPA: ABC transporter permease [Gemmatimonadaceae bacterium]|nr:ABC transporter permease [Gemmatimonadaceae bacterium]